MIMMTKMSLKPEAAWGVEAKEDTNIDLSVGGSIRLLSPIFIYDWYGRGFY